MIMEKHWKRIEKCHKEFERCIDLANRCKRGYEYWKPKKGIKSIINRRIFLIVNKLACKLANSWLKEDASICLEISNKLSEEKGS